MTATTSTVLAAIYTRQSHGKERSITEQESDGRTACEAGGWQVAEVYADTTSASSFARKGRPGWERLLADLDAGRFGILVMWESSRGDRKLSSWSLLLDKCEERGVLIHVVSHARTYDLRLRRDWKTLADEGVDSADESKKTSERLLRAMAASAVAGRPHGPVVYGYERIYDPHTRQLAEQQPDLKQAAVVREIFSSLADGLPVSTLAAQLNQRGVPAPTGGRWGRTTIRRIAGNPAYLGKRTSGVRTPEAMVTYDGIWAPLVDEATFITVQARLSDPARNTTRPGRARWLLSYIALCGTCGAPLAMHKKGAAYRCSAQLCTTIRSDWLDVYISNAVVGWVQAHAVESLLKSEDAAVVAARTEARRLQAQLDTLAKDLDLSPRTLALREHALLPKIRAAQRRAMDAGLPLGVRSLARAREAVPQAWEDLPLAAKREVIAGLMTIRVKRARRKGAGTVGEFQERVVIEWKTG